MTAVPFRAMIASGVFAFFSAQSQAQAGSLMTDAFVANLKPNVAFLEQSGRLALNKSPTSAVRAYAQTGMVEAAKLAAAVEIMEPSQVASVSTDENQVKTGRSVAVGAAAGFGQAANGRAPMGRDDLDALARLSGRKFLDAFWLKQLDALSQLRADYEDYADHGDDAALVALAKRQLPEVERRLALLARI